MGQPGGGMDRRAGSAVTDPGAEGLGRLNMRTHFFTFWNLGKSKGFHTGVDMD